MSTTQDPGAPLRPIADLAADLIALRSAERWRKAAGLLRFNREFARHGHDPAMIHELEAVLATSGETCLMLDLPIAEMNLVPTVVTTQHTVGHGGFHSGVLGDHRPRLRWVYDCGALRKDGLQQLARAIDALSRDGRVLDFLSPSHLDRDHISGVERLMGRMTVRTVVLPYLDDLQQLAVLVADAAESPAGAPDPALLRAVTDPTGWLSGLGAGLVVQIAPARDGGTARIFQRDFEEDAAEAGDLPAMSAVYHPQRPVGVEETADAPARSGSGWVITNAYGTRSDWCLVPQVSPATRGAREALGEALQTLLGRDPETETWVEAFRRKLKDDTFVPKLKEAYRAHDLGDANAISMSLYAGPYRDGIVSRSALLETEWSFRPASGWLLTGDAKLAQVGRRTDWLQFFAPVRRHVGYLMLPHHGSHHNFHEGLLAAMADDGMAFACRGDRKGYPLHEDVWPFVEHLRHRIVTDAPATRLMTISAATAFQDAAEDLRTLAEAWR